jgi:hypothetical protein
MKSLSGPTSWHLTRLPFQPGIRASCQFSLQYPDGSEEVLSLEVYRDGTEPDHGLRRIHPNVFHVYVVPGECGSSVGVVGSSSCSPAIRDYRMQF